MNHQVVINKRFCGPPESGNGGYTCGVLSQFINGDAEVTLIKPPPLERILTVEKSDDGIVLLKDGELIVAKATSKVLDLETPFPPGFQEAQSSTLDSSLMGRHPFPTCFVCGPQRRESDGLRIFPGPITGKSYVATTWIPDCSLGDDEGKVKKEFIWAALDCPGAWAIFWDNVKVVVLGKLAVQIKHRIKVQDHCIVIGWKISELGRKIMTGSAVFSEDGQLCAKALATWIELI